MIPKMIRSLLICSALVASSGAGAVALSALHDATGDRHVRTLAPAPVATVEPRFVIPSFAPAAKAPEVIEVALRDAPVLPVTSDADRAPAALAEPVVASVPSAADVFVPLATKPVATPEPRKSAAKPKARASSKSVQTARAVRKETVRTFKQRSTRPVIVAQAPAFTAQQPSSLQPDWVIGVYR